MACIDDSPDSQRVLRRASRLATRLGGELLAVFVETADWANEPPETKRAVEENVRYAEDLGAEVVRTNAQAVAAELARVARERNAHIVVMGRPRHHGLLARLRGSNVSELIERLPDAEVHVVPRREEG